MSKHEILVFMVDMIHAEVNNLVPDETLAMNIAERIVDVIKCQFGGQMIYIPKGVKDQWEARDKEIRAKFDGSNHAELAHEYRLSQMRIRQILERMRRAKLASST